MQGGKFKIGIRKLIAENSHLFWYMKEEDKCNISTEFLVETILNYGNQKSVRSLFDIVGVNEVSRIFFEQTKKSRCNYFPQVINYFSLYFKKHAG